MIFESHATNAHDKGDGISPEYVSESTNTDDTNVDIANDDNHNDHSLTNDQSLSQSEQDFYSFNVTDIHGNEVPLESTGER